MQVLAVPRRPGHPTRTKCARGKFLHATFASVSGRSVFPTPGRPRVLSTPNYMCHAVKP